MTRRAVGVDRVIVFLLGAVLVAAGAAAVAWQRRLIGGGHPLPTLSPEPWQLTWWPWALGSAGVIVVIIGLRWLAAHRFAPKARRLPLGGDQSLTADAVSVAHAGAAVLGRHPAVHKARGTAVIERGQPVLSYSATVAAGHGLTAAVQTADQVAGLTAAALGDGIAIRTVLAVEKSTAPIVS